MVRDESREVGSPIGSRLSSPGMLGALTSRHLHHHYGLWQEIRLLSMVITMIIYGDLGMITTVMLA